MSYYDYADDPGLEGRPPRRPAPRPEWVPQSRPVTDATLRGQALRQSQHGRRVAASTDLGQGVVGAETLRLWGPYVGHAATLEESEAELFLSAALLATAPAAADARLLDAHLADIAVRSMV